MKRKRKSTFRSPLQLAADKRNWRLAQAARIKTFFEKLGLKGTANSVHSIAVSEINLQWEQEKRLAS